MNRTPPMPRHWIAFLAVLALIGCAGDTSTNPTELDPSYARGAGGGGKVTVKSTVPRAGARGTTLNVSVRGSGYTEGSRAVWGLNGDTAIATTKVKVNSTTFVSSSELSASVTIAEDASLDLYDVVVITLAGKKGIGIELFEVTYQIIGLPDPNGASEAIAINSSGIIAGAVRHSSTAYLPARWTPTGATWTVELLTGVTSGHARGINDAGEIAGGGQFGGSQVGSAAVWLPGGGVTDLGPGLAYDINSAGTVVGASRDHMEAVVWRRTSPTTWGAGEHLPNFPNSAGIELRSHALAINDAGVIVGEAWDAAGNGYGRAVSWRLVNGVWAGPFPLDERLGGWAQAINEQGDAAGGFCTSPCTGFSAALFPVGGSTMTLATLGPTSAALGINGQRQVVGRVSTITSKVVRSTRILPAFWTPSTLVPLPLLANFSEGMAEDINDNGEIVGTLSSSASSGKAVIWRTQ